MDGMINHAFDSTPWLQALAVLEERINNGAFKKNAGIKTKEFRNRFRPTHPLRMGLYKEDENG
jgi:hypothetical protein